MVLEQVSLWELAILDFADKFTHPYQSKTEINLPLSSLFSPRLSTRDPLTLTNPLEFFEYNHTARV